VEREELERRRQELVRLRLERDELAGQLALVREEASRAVQELDALRASPYWRLMTRFTSLGWLKRLWLLIPNPLRQGLKRLLSGTPVQPALPVPAGSPPALEESGGSDVPARPPLRNAEVPQGLRSFFDGCHRLGVNEIVMFVSGVKFLENEGQRGTQMARELLASGAAVLMVFFRWPEEQADPVPLSDNPLLFHLPLDLLDSCRNELFSFEPPAGARKTCIIEFPHPETFQLVNELNAARWHTVYDIIDDWEEFHREGAAPWYEPEVEDFLCLNAGSLTAVVPKLVSKIQSRHPARRVRLVPNGVSPASFHMDLPPLPLEKGELTAGYFGYLSRAWFDWELILDIARRRPGWELHIVGYGEKPDGEIPSNIHLHGKVDHERLYSFAATWDVGIVPFKESDLSRGADPIKVYEYLAMGLPVVVTGIPHLQEYPGVFVAPSRHAFAATLSEAVETPFPREAVAAFLDSCTWYQRALALLDAPVDARLPEWSLSTSNEDAR